MQTIADRWLSELPQQFQAKKNIEVLITSLAKQMQEILDVIKQLENLDIDTATGINLDSVGSIVALTRKEASAMQGNNLEMDDETYRQYLRYKVLLNTNECTYYELMEGINMLWDIEKVIYEEDPNYPATIILNMPMNGNYLRIGAVPMIKSAGVRIIWKYKIEYPIDMYVGCNMQTIIKQNIAPVAENIDNAFSAIAYTGVTMMIKRTTTYRCEIIKPPTLIKVYDTYDLAMADEDNVPFHTVGVYIDE